MIGINKVTLNKPHMLYNQSRRPCMNRPRFQQERLLAVRVVWLFCVCLIPDSHCHFLLLLHLPGRLYHQTLRCRGLPTDLSPGTRGCQPRARDRILGPRSWCLHPHAAGCRVITSIEA